MTGGRGGSPAAIRWALVTLFGEGRAETARVAAMIVARIPLNFIVGFESKSSNEVSLHSAINKNEASKR
jgi:hypothetical protein